MQASSSSLQVNTSFRQIFRMALPISLALLVPQLNYVINNIFIGHYDETGVLLGVASITGVYYLIFAGIGYGLNNGIQVLIARRAGEGKPEEIGKIFNQGLIISLTVAVAGILFTWFLAPLILKRVLESELVYQQAVDFLRIRIWGLLFLYVYQMRNALLIGINQSRYLVVGTLAETLANIFFDYGFIFGAFGFPELGFNGAAIASIIAEFTGMFVVYMVVRGKGFKRQFELKATSNWNKYYALLIISISAPLVFQHAISVLSWDFFYILVERNASAPTDLGVSNAMRNVFGVFGVVVWAFAATCNAMVSNLIGQNKMDQVLPLIYRITAITTSFALVAGIILNFSPGTFLSVYGLGPDFVEAGVPVLRVVSVAMLVMAFGTVWLNGVTGTGNSRKTLLIELVAIIFYSIYVFIVLEKLHLSITVGWMAEWIYWSILFALSFWYLKRRAKREERIANNLS